MPGFDVSATQNKRKRQKASRGQNLVELALTLPFVIVMMFAIIEFGRVWYTYEGVKMAVNEGLVVASNYYSPSTGQTRMQQRLAAAGLTASTATITQVPGQQAWQANATVQYTPFFGNLSIPSISGPITILPANFDISYTAVQAVSIY